MKKWVTLIVLLAMLAGISTTWATDISFDNPTSMSDDINDPNEPDCEEDIPICE